MKGHIPLEQPVVRLTGQTLLCILSLIVTDTDEVRLAEGIGLSRKDHYHDAVKRALVKDGWKITAEQYYVMLPERRLWIDLRAVKNADNFSILVEVKGFKNKPSYIEYLASVIGKYVIYRAALDRLNINVPLYLAVPIVDYTGILSETIGQLVIQKLNIPLVLFDQEKEEIARWIA